MLHAIAVPVLAQAVLPGEPMQGIEPCSAAYKAAASPFTLRGLTCRCKRDSVSDDHPSQGEPWRGTRFPHQLAVAKP